MRKQRELFAQDGHSYKFRVIIDASGMAEALERLFVLHRVRAKFNGMEVKHPDRFADVTNRAFVTEYVLAMGKRGHAYFFELEIAGKLAASQLAFAVGTDLWFYSSGFDPEWRKYGVMTMLTVEVLQWAIRERISRVNLSCGLDRGKVRWRPSEITVTHFLWRAPGTRARIFMQALQVLEASRLATAKLRGYRQGRDGVAEG